MFLYNFIDREMRHLGSEPGEIAVYASFHSRRESPFRNTGEVEYPSSHTCQTCVFRLSEDSTTEGEYLRVETSSENGLGITTVYLEDGDYYRFEMEESNNLLRQTAGPDKPFIMANFGTLPLRVDTISGGRFTVPCGTLRRLEGLGDRPKHKVLLTFISQNAYDFRLIAEILGKDGRWNKLDIITDKNIQTILDDGAIVAQLRRGPGRTVQMIDRLESVPDHEIFIRGSGELKFQHSALRLENGIPAWGEVSLPKLTDGKIYDYSRLRNALLPERCVVGFPNVSPMPPSNCSPDICLD